MSTFQEVTELKNALAAIVKPENIVGEPARLEDYAKDCSFVTGSRPLLAVFPETRDEVKGIVRLANETKIPIVPVSSKPPRFHGDTVPCQSGIIVDFQRMKRIIKIDSLNRCAMIEPGVTYSELIPEVKKQGLKLNIPLLPRASKSVVTSLLEREPVLIPKYQYDYVDPLLTLEVIYGTGDELRTGSASGPGDLEHLKSDKVNPWGPGSVDYYRLVSGAQGTMGLVTWAMVKTEVLPTLQKIYFIPCLEPGEVSAFLADLTRKRVVDECLVLNNVSFASILAGSWSGDYRALRKTLPPWTVITCVAGYQRRPEERLEIQARHLLSICHEHKLKPQEELPNLAGKGSVVLDLLSNCWPGEPYWKQSYKGSYQDIFFLAPLSRVADFVSLMKNTVARHTYSYDDIGCYIQPMVQGRGCHCEFDLPYDASSSMEKSEVKSLFLEASELLFNNGAFFSRPYGPWADMVYSRYPDGVLALKKLKGIFDPNNILNPGKLCFQEGHHGQS